MATAAPDRLAGPSDLQPPVAEEQAPKKASRLILLHEIEEGLDAIERPLAGLFVSGLSAGLDVGFSLFLMAVVLTRVEGTMPPAVVSLLLANMYAVGFIFVVLGRSELFTEQTTLAVLPVLGGRASIRALLRLWVIVFAANTLGAAVFAALATLIGPELGVINPKVFGTIAHRMTDHSAWAMFLSGLLAGWLMGLLSWLVAASRDTISQIVLVWLVTTVIGFANLHHAIVGTVEVLAGAFSGQGIGPRDIGRFLVWVTAGNIVGGVVFVAFLKYGHARPEAQTAP
ncbi:MAG: formate/nitrite transporter family protein [Isosphaeraceae bacterium]|nr:formate/nitrite transporter family protein [Isosphaeraceae bacterium]MDR3658979.1 formate/nitrite transporter family protein [Mycobacterium sp.]